MKRSKIHESDRLAGAVRNRKLLRCREFMRISGNKEEGKGERHLVYVAHSPILPFADSGNHGLGRGVGRPLGVGIDLGVGVGLGVAVGVALGVGVMVAVAVGVGVVVGVAVAVGVGVTVGVGVGPCPPGNTRT